jgi:hypothetical protein
MPGSGLFREIRGRVDAMPVNAGPQHIRARRHPA